MVFNFYSDLTSSVSDDFILNCINNFDIATIEHFIHNPMPNSPDELTRHNHLVETRRRLDFLIKYIKAYETENTENSNLNLESI